MVGFVFGRRGFSMEACSSFFLPRLIGTSRALHLTTTGGVYPATHKLFDGLFSEVVAPEEVLPTALRIADEIAANVSGVSARVMKDMIYRSVSSPEEAHLLESKIFWHLFTGKDAKEGMQSFLEKRKPEFTGTMEKNAPSAWPWWTPVDIRRSKLNLIDVTPPDWHSQCAMSLSHHYLKSETTPGFQILQLVSHRPIPTPQPYEPGKAGRGSSHAVSEPSKSHDSLRFPTNDLPRFQRQARSAGAVPHSHPPKPNRVQVDVMCDCHVKGPRERRR
ncbi:hypothetical protein NM208_g17040 [Fusarium decemcellulare]|uniref:Uncharacterized protein n=1 Tax=Fusarium decemcellulare TaxID=57161 RepID=A0ACC1R9V8_9HYPO|nr:hypothetical protein NM208_g17040 [Fusarium decemcellulare]